MSAPVPAQIAVEQLAGMTPDEITAAFEAGQLDETLGRPVLQLPTGQLGDEHIAQMTPTEIAKAFEAGQLDALLGRPVTPPAAPPAEPDWSTVPPPDPAVYAAIAQNLRTANPPA